MAGASTVTDSVADAVLRVVPRLARLMERELVRSGSALSVRQLRVLQRLHDGEQIAAEIARHSSVGPAAMQGVLDGLVDRGLVLRQRSSADRRKQLLALTPDGENALRAGNLIIQEAVGALVQDMKKTEQAQIAEGLERLQGAIDLYVSATRVSRTPSVT
ncbi:MAG TPA: MarR family transcriptional regulator [Dehalococcoidia bacterium]|nr:MarR family transcriptional regulator [Dehalococcoidia bacterium]